MGWLRLPKNDPVIKKYGDPTAGPTSSHYEVIFSPGMLQLVLHLSSSLKPIPPGFAAPGIPAPSNGTFNTVFSALISPTSRMAPFSELRLFSI
jgi:hypothetical protein